MKFRFGLYDPEKECWAVSVTDTAINLSPDLNSKTVHQGHQAAAMSKLSSNFKIIKVCIKKNLFYSQYIPDFRVYYQPDEVKDMYNNTRPPPGMGGWYV